MNFSEVFQTLNQASAFELFRLRAAIDRALEMRRKEEVELGPVWAPRIQR